MVRGQNMTRSIFILALVVTAWSCRNTPVSPGTQNNLHVTGIDVANKIQQWSLAQPEPFVVCILGDTTSGMLYDVGDMITNLVLNTLSLQHQILDTLLVDTSWARTLDRGRTAEQVRQLYDSVTAAVTEEQMSALLCAHGFKLRMMKYDSLTYALNSKLWQWARHQYPPKIVSSGFYFFVRQGPGTGGYSHPSLTPQGTQNLQYFTRRASVAILESAISTVDTSLSFTQLAQAMSQIAPIEAHDTSYWPE